MKRMSTCYITKDYKLVKCVFLREIKSKGAALIKLPCGRNEQVSIEKVLTKEEGTLILSKVYTEDGVEVEVEDVSPEGLLNELSTSENVYSWEAGDGYSTLKCTRPWLGDDSDDFVFIRVNDRVLRVSACEYYF